MQEPRDFPKAFAVTGPVMVSIYLVVALVGHYYGVQEGDIVQGMPRNSTLRVVAGLLFAHVMVVYLIKSVVLQRYIHRFVSPACVDQRSGASYATHGGIGIAMLLLGFLIANAVPFFSQLL